MRKKGNAGVLVEDLMLSIEKVIMRDSFARHAGVAAADGKASESGVG